MTCAEFEILLCDYIDDTLDAAQRSALQQHMSSCPTCARLAADAASAADFISRAEDVEPPPELLAKIAFQIPSGLGQASWRIRWFGWLEPVMQPRFAMGMAMTILSFSMLARLAGLEVRQLRPSDLEPAAVWSAVDNRMHRTWERAVKYYENLRLVYEVQNRLQEWTEQEEEERRAAGKRGQGSNPGQRGDKDSK